VRIPPHSDHSFRYKLTTDSAALWPPIPLHCDHPFRCMVTTFSPGEPTLDQGSETGDKPAKN